MKQLLTVLVWIGFISICSAQTATHYSVSFGNAVHHEAQIIATFTNLQNDKVEFRMSRSSPGRYALHEFAKNVYNVKVTDGNGNVLNATRPDPYSWEVQDHDGTVIVSYTLFANYGDGTYAQVDETHAHLNMPATFIYVPELSEKGMEVTFDVREDLNWKVATQLKHKTGDTYYADNLQYFMDSPTEISNYRKRSFQVGNQTINFVLHDDEATDEQIDQYFERIKAIVLGEEKVFGELPSYDYGEYTFLACYMPNVDGDGMEHRNSTITTSSRSLADGGVERNIETVSHEFFHCWNVERIRPESLEPFDFTRVNMSGELWFAEGFTSYFSPLTMCRTETWSLDKYLEDMARTFNYVWTSPGRQFFNPIGMSYHAPFVDAARSVDETNWENTFISYYPYGEMLGLALDLSLREKHLNLDDYMKLMWNNFGKPEKPYAVDDIKNTLIAYAGEEFGNTFFDNYIYTSEMPDYKTLFKNVGIDLKLDESKVSFGARVRDQKIISNPTIGSTAYEAGFEKGDKILKIGEFELDTVLTLDSVLNIYTPGEIVKMEFSRYDKEKDVEVTLKAGKKYSISLTDDKKVTDAIIENRNRWLHKTN